MVNKTILFRNYYNRGTETSIQNWIQFQIQQWEFGGKKGIYKDQWEFTARSRLWGVIEMTRRKFQGWGNSRWLDLTGFLLKAAQDKSAATLMGGRMRVLIRYQERSHTEDESWAFSLNWLAGFLLKLSYADVKARPKDKVYWEKNFEEVGLTLVKKRLRQSEVQLFSYSP